MLLTLRSHTVFIGALTFFLISCSNIDQIESSTPDQIASQVKVISEPEGNYKVVTGPLINVRAGFGKFSANLLTGGGAGFGNSLFLEAKGSLEKDWSYRLIASIQYTNLGGVYRHYDKAGIEGAPDLEVVILDMDKQFTINSINMTETLGISIEQEILTNNLTTGFTFRIADSSNNIEELNVPSSYIKGFLQAVENTQGIGYVPE